MELKHCKTCQEEKELSGFTYRKRLTKTGEVWYYEGECKACTNKRRNSRHAKLRNQGINPEPVYKRHGLTKEQYENMLEEQGGKCANPFCDNPAEVIDHDHGCCPGKHSCGKCVRGLLCAKCNTAEGMLETIEKMQGLIEYTRKWVNRNGLD